MTDEEGRDASWARREAAAKRILDAEDAAAPPTVPAGWYAHPDRPDLLRYWDGTTWTTHTAPAPNGTAPAPGAGGQSPAQSGWAPLAATAGRDESAYVWTLAVLPLLWLPFDYFVPAASAAWGAIVLAWILNGLFANRDSTLLAGRGIKTDSFLAWLLVPAYLVQRTRRAGSTPLIPIVWCFGFAVSVLGAFSFAASYEFDGTANADYLERRIERQSGLANVTVECPDKVVRDGDIVWCDLSAAGYGTQVRLDIVGDGTEFSFNWQVS